MIPKIKLWRKVLYCYIWNCLIGLNKSLNCAAQIYSHYRWRNRVNTGIECTIWLLCYKFLVLLKFFNHAQMVSSCLFQFVMPDRLKLYYISIHCCECKKTCVLSTPSLIKISIVFYSQTTEHIKLILNISGTY